MNNAERIADLRARAEEQTKTKAVLFRLNMELYGFTGKLLTLLHENKVAEAVTLLEASQRVCQERLINR